MEVTRSLLVHAAPSVTEEERVNLQSWAKTQGLEGHLFQTSGSSGGAKWVHLTGVAIEASAKAVNSHLKATSADRWLRALPDYHVGGYMIGERARLSGSRVDVFEESWSPEEFCETCDRCQSTLASLVPTQVVDLVNQSLRAPVSLRAVLVGGGALGGEWEERARGLGWPLLLTYGMTETASQIATGSFDAPSVLQVLPIWCVETIEEGRLKVSGEALFSGYVSDRDDSFIYEKPFDEEGAFLTQDRVVIEEGGIRFLSRCDEVVKVLGELVDLARIEQFLSNFTETVVVAKKDSRKGSRLIAVGLDEGELNLAFEAWNAQSAGFERLDETCVITEFPRTELGKVSKAKLFDQIDRK